MQPIHYAIAAVVGGLAILAYVFQAGKWAATREQLDKKVEELKADFKDHILASDKRFADHGKKISDNDSRITRVENDRRIVVFPRARRRREEFDDEGHEE